MIRTIALYIIGALLLLFFGISRVTLAVRITFGETLRVDVRAGPKQIQLVPKQARSGKKEKKPKRRKAKPADGQDAASKKKKQSITPADIRSMLPAVWESLRRALRGTGKRIRIDPLQLCVVFGGEDPAATAELYGWACSAMWAVMPRLEQLVQLPDPRLHLDLDFDENRTRAEGAVGIRLRIGDVTAIGFSAAWPLLKWLLTRRRGGGRAAAVPSKQEEVSEKIA